MLVVLPLTAQTPAGTVIRNRADGRYVIPSGVPDSSRSLPADVTVGRIGGLTLVPPRAAIARPGDSVVFAHRLSNTQNVTDAIGLVASSAVGWPVAVYRDLNGNGLLDGGDIALSGPVTLPPGGMAPLLLQVRLPNLRALRGSSSTTSLMATSASDGTMTVSVADTITVPHAGVALALSKSVDRATATTGDQLAYTVAYSATGTASATATVLTDTIPAGTSYVPGSLTWNGAALTDAVGDDAGNYDAGARVIGVQAGDVAAGAGGQLGFLVTVTAGSGGLTLVRNAAAAAYGTQAGPDTVVSAPVVTTLDMVSLALRKNLLTSGTVQFGDQVDYQVDYSVAPGTVTARGAVLSDTLPQGLQFVGATPAPQVNGQVLTWALGDLAPGSTGQVRLTVRVGWTGLDTLRLRNVATLAAVNGTGVAATALEVVISNASSAALALDKTANLLEAGLGEVVPYTLVVRNSGLVPLADLVLEDRLPDGMKYVPGTALGVDSAVARGRLLRLYLVGPLAPDSGLVVHYQAAIASAESAVLRNTAVATAGGGLVRSGAVSAFVRLRASAPMETRAVIGKVWADLDGNGVQGADEPGVEGVDIWTVGGEIATSDRDGRFSFRNMQPGRHGFRLDASTLPAGYGLVDAPLADLELRDASGWTTPRVTFRVTPRAARLLGVDLPVPWKVIARPVALAPDSVSAPLCGVIAKVDRQPIDEPVLLRSVEFGLDRATLTPAARLALDAVAAVLLGNPGTVAVVAGHTDATGSASHNLLLSYARAAAARNYLIARGVASRRLPLRGFGRDRPVTNNRSETERARNRRATLELLRSHEDADRIVAELLEAVSGRCDRISVNYMPIQVTTEVAVSNPYDVPLAGLGLDFEAGTDSLRVLSSADTAAAAALSVLLPSLEPHGAVSVRAWRREHRDSATVVMRAPGGEERIVAEVHNPLRPAAGRGGIRLRADSLPVAGALPLGGTADVWLAPPAHSHDAVYLVPSGWEFVAGSLRDEDGDSLPSALLPSRTGEQLVAWTPSGRAAGTVQLMLRPSGSEAGIAAAPVALTPLRDAEARAQDKRMTLTAGPGIEFFAPVDGTVLPSDHLFVGVRGEPGMAVVLFDGDSVVRETSLRIDGVQDFVAVKLGAGPHHLRVRQTNSWGRERWDSLVVHVTGGPADFVANDASARLRADGHAEAVVRIRVVDRWGVPVVNRPAVTVAAEGAGVITPDADPSSVGTQIRPDSGGWLRVTLRAGHEVKPGTLRLSAGEAQADLSLVLLPALQPLMITGMGRVGVGASADDFGAVTARGRLDDRTSLVLSYDSRALDAGQDAFGRTSDPLEEAQYPILGDASAQRSVTASRGRLAARVQRGYDWLALGDVLTSDFAHDLALARYGRAITGAAARVTTGEVTWQGFGASTDRHLRQEQLRGAGTAGPYVFGGGVAPGTDVVTIETRALENPERVLSKQALIRYVDYQLDYGTGALLFKHPVPASDSYGNPIFIVAAYESTGGGDASAVWGVRAATDPRRLLRKGLGLDSLRIGATWVQDGGAAGGTFNLGGADLRLSRGPLELGGEVAVARSPDSSGTATTVDGGFRLGSATRLSARWLHVGAGFHNPSAVALRPRSDEIAIGARSLIAGNELLLDHTWQRFETDGVSRRRSRAGVSRPLAPGLRLSAALADDRSASGSARSDTRAGELELGWVPRPGMRLWAEGRKLASSKGAAALPSHLAAGAAVQLTPAIAVEARHRQVFLPGDSGGYGVTNLGLRTRLDAGTEAWGSYQIAGLAGAQGAAVVGLGTRKQLGPQWSVRGTLERRVGIGRASRADPTRAAPFVQSEEDYWAVGLGAELLPQRRPYRATLRAELRDGALNTTRLFAAAGAVSFTPAFALLSRQELLRNDLVLPTGRQESRRLWSLWGVAFRPTRSDRLNLLGKLEWLDVINPQGGGVLANQGAEGRFIASGEGIYEPSVRSEVAARYAVRRTRATLRYEDGLTQQLRTFAHFVGGRGSAFVGPRLGARLDARALFESRAGLARYDLAPQAIYLPLPGIEVAAGYRLGTLRDPDFAANGGQGVFLTIGAQLTEGSLASVRDFWFRRLGWQAEAAR